MTAFIANSNVVELIGLKSAIEGAWINDATVTVTIELNGVAVAGATWPLTMAYVAASDGNYRAVLSEGLALSKLNHVAMIDADAGPNRVGHWEFKFKPAVRTS